MVITKVKSIIFLISVISIFCLAGCDFVRSPYTCSGYKHDVYIQKYYSDGIISEKIRFSYGEQLGSMGKKHKITAIKVFNPEDKLIAEYPEEYLNNLRKTVKYKDEFWVVTEKALYLVPQTRQKKNDWLEYIKSLETGP